MGTAKLPEKGSSLSAGDICLTIREQRRIMTNIVIRYVVIKVY